MTKHEPIETAPKDGSLVFLFVPDLGWRPAEWTGRAAEDATGWVHGWWSPTDYDTQYHDPTHWMWEPEWPVEMPKGGEEGGEAPDINGNATLGQWFKHP